MARADALDVELCIETMEIVSKLRNRKVKPLFAKPRGFNAALNTTSTGLISNLVPT